MADKQLTDAAWKTFAKGKGYKDAAFLKALEGLAKGEREGPAAVLEALTALEKAADDLRKAHKSDKDLGGYLDDVAKAVDRERKGAEKSHKAAEAAEAAEAAAAQGAEDDEGPAALTTKLVPLVRLAKKGEPLHAMLALASKDAAVLLSRKAISVARRKLLTEQLGTTSGVKYVDAAVIFEASTVTFVVQAQAAGLAKRIRQALLNQTGERLKVRVRGVDPNDVDEDGGDEPADATGGEAAAAGVVPEAPPMPGQAQAPAPASGKDEAVAFNARLKALVPRVQQAVADKHAQAQDIRLKISEAGALARKADFGRATALLDEAQGLLDAPAPAPGAPVSAPAAAAVNPQRFVNHARARLAWASTRQRVAGDLQRLEAAILAHYEGEDDLPELAQSVRQLDRILAELDESLADKLDEALNAADLAQRADLHEQARGILARYGQFVGSDTLLASLDANPFVPLTTHKTLMAALQVLDKSLA